MRIGIDATNLGSGGGITHLKEILTSFNISSLSANQKIIIFSSTEVLDQLPEMVQVEKITFTGLNRNLFNRIFFQLFFYDKEIKRRCDILLSITGDYIGAFRPVVGISQNMLLYEREIWKKIKQPSEILRFWLIYQKQKISFGNSEAIIFISDYARKYISKKLNIKDKETTIIHHGISTRFIKKVKSQKTITEYSFSNPFKFLYVSTIHEYKNQWNVVEAVGILREKGFPIELSLVGGVIFKPAGRKLEMSIQKVDPINAFIHNHGHVSYDEIDEFYNSNDGIIFASTCENMPNILIESMASGIPIASSNKQPMPEFLKENGFYFDAYSVDSIVKTLIEFLNSPQEREINAINALKEASKYSWEETSEKTFEFLTSIYKDRQYV
ncbi:MAG: glycosyltransferase family 1 protein [Bacteroidales bacterium]|nr:glycosyltransferase family 1 protein [Bacteroidales bacterium]